MTAGKQKTRRHHPTPKPVVPVAESRFLLWQHGPNFDTDLPQNVYALEGKTASLSCRVFRRENKTVMFPRGIDRLFFLISPFSSRFLGYVTKIFTSLPWVATHTRPIFDTSQFTTLSVTNGRSKSSLFGGANLADMNAKSVRNLLEASLCS